MAVNLLWCLPGQVGGSEEYLVRQLIGMSEIEHRFQLTVFAPHGFRSAHPEICQHYEVIEAPGNLTRRPLRVAMENSWLALKTHGFDVVHHGGGTLPVIGKGATVLTVHDLQYLTFPQYFSEFKLRYLKTSVPRSIKRAKLIAVPSDYVRSSVIKATNVAPDKVFVVPHGVEPHIGSQATPANELRAKYQLGTGPVLVFPAITHPHKNHIFLLELMAAKWTDPQLRLVLPGGQGLAEAQVEQAVNRLGLRDRVVRLGRVSAADRDGLLKMALGLVFPSMYEGFGAPVIEAMSLGVPVACSDQASLPGVVGNAGLIRSLTIDEWADVPDQLRDRRDELVALGHRRILDFSSKISGQAALDIYERCAQ